MDIKAAHNLQEKERTEDIEIDETVNFDEMFLSDAVLNGLHACGYIRPSPIQLKSIPLGRCGLDLIVQAKSGTGKTCVFTVVALEMISVKAKTTQVLVIAPTREIAVQIGQVINSIGSSLPELKAYTFIGGISLLEDKAKLSCCHIAIGTPGRLNQLVSLGHLNLTNVRLLVLDEADQLLTGQFKSSILELVKTSPFNKQILALSATYPKEVTEFLDQYMRSPSHVRLGKESPALLGVKQFARILPDHPQSHARHKLKFTELLSILSSISFNQCLVFSNSQLRAESICNQLKSSGWPAAFLTGGQVQTERLQSYFALCSYKCRILVSTDLSARGLDSEHVNLVINLDIPMDQATYLHRIGRAGRFGSIGISISLACEGTEWEAMRATINMTNVTIKVLPEKFDTDSLQKSYEILETVECLDEEKFSQFLGKANKRKPKLSLVSAVQSVDELFMEQSKKIIMDNEIKASQKLKINSNSSMKDSKVKKAEEEKYDMSNQTVKAALHDYNKEVKIIPISHDKLVSHLSEDLENILQFDKPQLSSDCLIREYPSATVFATLESYINNKERNTDTKTAGLKYKQLQSSSSFSGIKILQNVLDGDQSSENSYMDTKISCSPIEDNSQSEVIRKEQNSHSAKISEPYRRKLDKASTSVPIISNEQFTLNLLPEENVPSSFASKTENIKCSDFAQKVNTNQKNILRKKEHSISSSDEVNLRTVPKKKLLKQKVCNENTGYGLWEPVTTDPKPQNKINLPQSNSGKHEFLEMEGNFSNSHYSSNDEDSSYKNTRRKKKCSSNEDNRHGNISNIPYSCPFYSHNDYYYNQYYNSSVMYIRAAEKFASMMEYTRSLGRMSAWIAQDNNNKLLQERQSKSHRTSKIKTSDSSK